MKFKESTYYIWFALVFISTITSILGYLEITKDDINKKVEVMATSLQGDKITPVSELLNPKDEDF